MNFIVNVDHIRRSAFNKAYNEYAFSRAKSSTDRPSCQLIVESDVQVHQIHLIISLSFVCRRFVVLLTVDSNDRRLKG